MKQDPRGPAFFDPATLKIEIDMGDEYRDNIIKEIQKGVDTFNANYWRDHE